MRNAWAIIGKAYNATLTIMSSTAFIVTFGMAVWMAVDVIGRSFFNRPVAGTPELVKTLLPAIVFLSLAYTLREKRHVYVDLLYSRLPVWLATICKIFANALGCALFTVVTIYSWGPAWAGWLIREYEGVQVEIPVYPVRFIMFFGAGVFAFQYFLNVIEDVRMIFEEKNRK